MTDCIFITFIILFAIWIFSDWSTLDKKIRELDDRLDRIEKRLIK